MSLIDVVTVGKHRIACQRIGNDPDHANVIMVNGAFATATSFRQTARGLCDDFNIILYDLPYAGLSRAYNTGVGLLTKDDEAHILNVLIAHYGVRHVCSMSWGGVATLMALSARPRSVRNAIIASFSPRMNQPMREYVEAASRFLDAGQYGAAAELLNDTVGCHLPRLLKLANHRHLMSLDREEVAQVHFHVRQLLALDVDNYLDRLSTINVPVLFLNGREDEYTTEADVRAFETRIPDCHFTSIPGGGHFLDLESRATSERVRHATRTFLLHSTLDRAPRIPRGLPLPLEAAGLHIGSLARG